MEKDNSASYVAGPSGARYPKKPGYDYFVITMEYKKSKKFGMMVKNAGVPPIVIVSTVSPGSLCDGLMKEMDHIIEVSNEGITDREQCKLLILNAFKTAQKVVLFVERASGPKAIDDMERLMNASLMMPSVEMRSDVRDICKRFNVKVHTTPAGQSKGIMRQAGLAPAANVKMADKPVQQLIAADMSCRIPQLQKVPQKKAPPPPRPTTPPPPPAPAPAQTAPAPVPTAPPPAPAAPASAAPPPTPAVPAPSAPPADAPSQEKRLSRENAQQEASQEQASENTQNEKSGADEGGSAEDATKQN